MKETYNIWLSDNIKSKYLSTVVADSFKSAITKTIIGCNLCQDSFDAENLTYNGIPIVRNNPKFN